MRITKKPLKKTRPENEKKSSMMRSAGLDVSLVRKLQAVILPKILPSSEEYETGMRFFPGEKIGGDMMEIIRISDDVLGLLAVDVAAPTASAITVAAMVKICISEQMRLMFTPFAVIDNVNKKLLGEVGMNMEVCSFAGYLDLHDNKFTYCNAGWSGLLFSRRKGNISEPFVRHAEGIGRTSLNVGGEDSVHIGPGDCLVLFSDGLYRLFGRKDTPGHSKAVSFIARALSNSEASDLMTKIEEKYSKAILESRIEDDITVLYVEMSTQSGKERIREMLGFESNEAVYLQFLNYLEEIDRTEAVILSEMDVAGYPDDMIRKMKIALTELLVNAIVHGNKRDNTKKVVVGHNINRQRAMISIMDEGTGFEPKTIPDPTLPENLDKPCGRGLFIVRHYVDSMEFNKTGNRVTIVKKNVI